MCVGRRKHQCSGSKSKSNSRSKGVREGTEKKRKKGIWKNLQSNSEGDSEWEPWMEAQTSRKEPKRMDTQVVRISNYPPFFLIAKWHSL